MPWQPKNYGDATGPVIVLTRTNLKFILCGRSVRACVRDRSLTAIVVEQFTGESGRFASAGWDWERISAGKLLYFCSLATPLLFESSGDSFVLYFLRCLVLLHMCCIVVTRWGGSGKTEAQSLSIFLQCFDTVGWVI